MAGLTNIFGGSDDSTSSNDSNSSTDIVQDATSTLGLDVSSSQSSFDQDEDGNTSARDNDTDIGLDTSTDSLLGALNDQSDSSDETTS